MALTQVSTNGVKDGSLLNADINSSAAIAVSKLANFVTNNADNRVITGSGTANTLNAESNLTYDGSTLIIGANAPKLKFNELNDNPDYFINANAGELNIHDDTNSSTKLTITATKTVFPNNNVGIGTTSPLNTLHIHGDGTLRISPSAGINQFESGRIRFTENTSDFQGGYVHYDGSSNIFHIGTHAANDTVVGNDLNAISIPRGSGNVGIGTTSPNETLTIINSASHSTSPCYIKTNGSNNVRVLGLQSLRAATSGGIAGSFIEFFKANGSAIGSVTGENSISYNTTSDYRLKENVVAISDGITRLKTLKPSRFNWIANPSTTVDGFLAHEVTAVPEAISGTKDEVDSDNNPVYQGIDQSKLVPLLVAAVQELIAKVETLETA